MSALPCKIALCWGGRGLGSGTSVGGKARLGGTVQGGSGGGERQPGTRRTGRS